MTALHATLLTALIATASMTRAESVPGDGGAASVRSMHSEAPRHPKQRATRPTPAPVSLHRADAFMQGVNRIELPPPTAPEGARQPNVAGTVRELMFDLGRTLRPDALMMDGPTPVWTLAVRSPGANALRLHFVEVDVEGSFIVYAPHGDGVVVRGPFKGKGPGHRGEFWTPSLPGDEAFIEYVGDGPPGFVLQDVGHLDTPIASPDIANEPSGTPNGCHLNAACQADLPQNARTAVGQMSFIKGGGWSLCSGTLLIDLDPNTDVPYFITANHCISSQDVADTLEVTWGWEEECDGTIPDWTLLPRTLGATLLENSSTDDGNDMSFFRLNEPVPPDVTFAGWTTATPPTSSGATRFPIHHPLGSTKRGGRFHRINPFLLCKSASRFWAFRCDDGMIEGGSSGSGIFNAEGQLQGQLYGRCCPPHLDDGGDCGGVNCGNNGSWNAVYGRFDYSYDIIGHWLEMGGTIHVDAAASPGGNGSPGDPFQTLTEAYEIAWDGARIQIAGGTYPEDLTLNKDITIVSGGGSAVIGE